MDAMKLLIADGNEEFRRALAAELQGAYHVRCCGDGKEALSLLRSFVPDVLVLDLMLPELDGISLLQSAASAGLCPMVLVTSRFYNDYILGALGELSVGYMMRKPCDIPATAARIGDLSRHIRAPLVTPPDPQTQVTNLLLSLNIPSKLLLILHQWQIQHHRRTASRMGPYHKAAVPIQQTQAGRNIINADMLPALTGLAERPAQLS